MDHPLRKNDDGQVTVNVVGHNAPQNTHREHEHHSGQQQEYRGSVDSLSPKKEAGNVNRSRSRVGFALHSDADEADEEKRVIVSDQDDAVSERTPRTGAVNPNFMAEEEDEEHDRLPPIRRQASKISSSRHHLDGNADPAARHRFHVGSETMMDTLHKPVEMVMNTLRRITSTDSITSHGVRRNSSHVNFRDAPTPRLDGKKKTASFAVESHISMEDVQHELADRATAMQRGISFPCFELFDEDEELDEDRSLPALPAPDMDDPVQVRRSHRRSKARIPSTSVFDQMTARAGSLASLPPHMQRRFSMGFDPLETLPSALNYDEAGGGQRATLDDLRREKENAENELVRQTGNENFVNVDGKLGWIQGVVLWTLQDMWAVQLFLRLAWMNAQAGMGLYTVIVLITLILALLTTLSMSAITTNGDIGVGGTYYMMARSLGPQFGAAIGVIITLANTINVSLNVQGFADLVTALLSKSNLHMINHLDDTRIISVMAIVVLTGFALLGMVIASRLKWLCLLLLLIGVGDVIVGSIVPPNKEDEARGFVGYSSGLFWENFQPAFQPDQFGAQDFMTVFAVFFPSLCGILAGTSITGDLKDPAGAIPKGTIVATLVAAIVYLILGWVSASVTLRHASGSVADLELGNLTHCRFDMSCKDGMINNMEIMGVIGHWEPIIYAAAFASTISTSVGCIHFAPKVFQALCRDNIIPGIHYFGKGYGKHDEPYRGYVLTMLIGVIFLMPSDFQFISNVVSNCYLATFALVNYATFDASFSQAPGWRPIFRYYNMWLSLATAIVCFGFMFALDWKSAIIALGAVGLVYLFVFYKKPQVNWGTSGQANIYRAALTDTYKLQKTPEHVKTYRPQILVLTGLPCVRPALVYMANAITRGTGLLVCGHVMVHEPIADRSTLEQETYKWFFRRKIRAFYEIYAAADTEEGTRALIQTSGLGKLRPNIVMMGYHRNWTNWNEDSMEEYINVIHYAFDSRRGVILFYARDGFDISDVVNFEQLVNDNNISASSTDGSDDTEPDKIQAIPLEVKPTDDPILKARVELAEKLEPGKKKKIVGEIHVWWLYDDGGLTLLVPYLMTQKSPWSGCKLKVFCLIGPDDNADSARYNMLQLLEKFRIAVVDVVAIDIDTQPSQESLDDFNKLIFKYKYENMSARARAPGPATIMESDMLEYGKRTIRSIRLHELLREHSSESVLNVLTMPLPKQNRAATLYLAILDMMTSGLPPTLLIRGNQENVLTYYC
ncbi:solute carrier family 12 member 3-like isoform X2 [Paramacrobiotus metropolitanus]|uniref:solute carrier family 12 member 3-like isoform X2 n=1 Tax=Paramacrobiotus metropolitanus TaxID=2943436 RepID=UPI002445FBCB|nr:solute carrier family 12 member 3-like isoform X2 [Paramacrobiotus metropolitanus]